MPATKSASETSKNGKSALQAPLMIISKGLKIPVLTGPTLPKPLKILTTMAYKPLLLRTDSLKAFARAALLTGRAKHPQRADRVGHKALLLVKLTLKKELRLIWMLSPLLLCLQEGKKVTRLTSTEFVF